MVAVVCCWGSNIVNSACVDFYLLRKKKPVVVAAAPVIDPYEEAMSQLDKLQQQAPGQKEYYSRLVDIFRVYIYKRKRHAFIAKDNR